MLIQYNVKCRICGKGKPKSKVNWVNGRWICKECIKESKKRRKMNAKKE